ncbi:MAG: hypothetical protein MO853_02925 [Candidatus Protistobacter heckmanni]|nr:hypothetical protein [Candidatus Protistobacter heckmanni]
MPTQISAPAPSSSARQLRGSERASFTPVTVTSAAATGIMPATAPRTAGTTL